MKNFNLQYYLLTVLLIMGGFAAMAQNGYGLTIIGVVCILFALIFLTQGLNMLASEKTAKPASMLEWLVLFLLASLFALKAFNINIPFIDQLTAISAGLLAVIYAVKLIKHLQTMSTGSALPVLGIGLLYGAIVLFSFGLAIGHLNAVLSGWMEWIALAMAAAFFLLALARSLSKQSADAPVSSVNLIAGFRDNAFLLIALFSIAALYTIFSRSGITPKLYSDEYPQAYFELVNRAEAGKDKKTDGQYPYEAFKSQYDRFVTRQQQANSK